jgi:hypothetical protein
MKNELKAFGLIALVAVIGFSMVGCDILFGTNKDTGNTNGNGTGSGTGNGTGTGTGDPKDNAKTVTVGYSSDHTISSSGEHWFKFTGTGDPVIFETTGDVVDTYMEVWDDYSNAGFGWGNFNRDDNSGEGNNALCSLITTSGTTYWIRITARSGTKGSYTFVVKEPTSNLKNNPIIVSVGNSSSHTVYRDGTHWFRFTGTGDRVFFETEGNVVNTNISIYIGDDTRSSYSKGNDKGINFFTVSGITYYISITGNSGTYTLILRNGIGDGSSKYYAIEVPKGYSSSYSITSSGEQWFTFNGTGNEETFKTTGILVDTYMEVWDDYSNAGFGWGNFNRDDNSGEGNNALCSFTTTSGTTYWIRITARSSTSGSFTFVVE